MCCLNKYYLHIEYVLLQFESAVERAVSRPLGRCLLALCKPILNCYTKGIHCFMLYRFFPSDIFFVRNCVAIYFQQFFFTLLNTKCEEKLRQQFNYVSAFCIKFRLPMRQSSSPSQKSPPQSYVCLMTMLRLCLQEFGTPSSTQVMLITECNNSHKHSRLYVCMYMYYVRPVCYSYRYTSNTLQHTQI